MFNRKIESETLGAPRQILANVRNQQSRGVIIPATMFPQDGTPDALGRKIIEAGTPIHIALDNAATPAAPVTAAVEATQSTPAVAAVPMNAVLLHDVDVAGGNASGTALYAGTVNLNRCSTAVQTAIATASAVTGASPLLVFVKL